MLEHATYLQDHATSSWIQQPEWTTLLAALKKLIEALSSYASYLGIRSNAMKRHHASPEPAVNYSDATSVRYLSKVPEVSPLLSTLDSKVSESEMYEIIFVNDFAPKERRQRYLFIRELEKGLSSSCFFFTYSHGSSVGNFHFVWKAPDHVNIEACSAENLRLIEKIKPQIPIHHTRAMKQEFYNMYGRITPTTKPYILRNIYHALTGDHSSARTVAEKEVDVRMAEALSMEDPDIIVDLRECNSNKTDKYAIFWEKCTQYLSSCTSVHERRHDSVTFMAKAISIRDLIEHVTSLCPEGTPIPSKSWVQFNFCLRNPRTHVAKL